MAVAGDLRPGVGSRESLIFDNLVVYKEWHLTRVSLNRPLNLGMSVLRRALNVLKVGRGLEFLDSAGCTEQIVVQIKRRPASFGWVGFRLIFL